MKPLDERRLRPAESNLQSPLRETASQTAGPYVHIGCMPNFAGVSSVFPSDLSTNQDLSQCEGQTITISGRVFDGEGELAKDVMLEFWQADHNGSYENGIWGRSATDLETGEYGFKTIMPGTTIGIDSNRFAPCISVLLFARGINLGLNTRMYFPQYEDENAADPCLATVGSARRKTLLCATTNTQHLYRFDIHLQGDSETVFFDA